jgi:hypothetical protein
LDLVVPKLPDWPIPTSHIRRNADQPCKSQPVPWMRQVPTGADLRSVRFGYTESCGYDRDFDPAQERLNLSEVGFLIQPNRLA